MHFLLIIILLCVLFPVFARFLGGILKGLFWLFVVAMVLGLFSAFSD